MWSQIICFSFAGEACISPLSVAGFCKARALTTKFHGSSAEKASRPFDGSAELLENPDKKDD